MHSLDDPRYQFSTRIMTTHHGHLFYGKDLSLNRNVLLYQLETKLSNEVSLGLIRRVNGCNHTNLLHILDISHSKQGILVVLELRKGALLSQAIIDAEFSFQKCLEVTMDVAKMVETTLEEGIRGFSISTDNFWITEDQTLMVINYWNESDGTYRGAIGLFHFLYQLLSESPELPDSVDKMKENLQTLKQARSLSSQDAHILDQLFHEAYSSSSSSLSFILLLSQLMHSRVDITEELANVLIETHFTPITEKWTDALRGRINQAKQDKIVKKVWTEKRKPLLAVAILLLVVMPIFIFFSDDEAGPVEEIDRLSPMSSNFEEENEPAADNEFVENDSPEVEQTDEDKPSVTVNETSVATIEHTEQSVIIEVPQLVGLSQQEAEQQALASGLRYEYFIEVNEEQAGTVFRQDMEAGASTSKGSKITFWVSKGLGL